MSLIDSFNLPNNFREGEGYELITRPSEVAYPDEDLINKTALKIVTQDRASALSWLGQRGYPIRWNEEERLYLFRVPQRFWEGTKIPRSALGMPLVYENVESILPQLVSGIFGDDPPFSTKPRPGTSMDAARANNALLAWELKRTNAREEIRLGLKYMLIHGTGIWKWGWQSYKKKRTIRTREQPYKFTPTPGGGEGGINLPQKNSHKLKKVDVWEDINEPVLEHRNLRYVLVDPQTRSSDIRKAKFVIDLKFPTLIEIEQLRDYEGYNLPEQSQLKRLMFPPDALPSQNPLETKGSIDLFGQEFQAKARNEKASVDPLQQPLELAEYWTASRVITILNKTLVIRNEPNPFGKIPFLSVTMSDILDSFYGIGVAMLNGNEQRMQQGVINGYLDDFALNINGVFTRVRGSNVMAQNLRLSPGRVLDQDAKDGIGILQRQPLVTGDTMSVLSSSDSRASRRTAASELAVQGTLPSSKSSATSTATGINALSSGTGTRLQSLVEQFSYQVFVPLLDAFHEMNSELLTPEQISTILSQELGKAYQSDTLEIINGQYDFDVVAGARLQSKAAMRQTLPLLYQFLLTEPVLTSLSKEGKKVNVSELVKMTFDVSGWPNMGDVIVPMTEQDVQEQQQNSPAAVAQAQQQAQGAQQNQQEDIKTSHKMQLLQEASNLKAGQDVLRELVRNDAKKSVGL